VGSFIEDWCGLRLVVMFEGKTQFEIRSEVGISKKLLSGIGLFAPSLGISC
jgi:uncharacterized protein (AIM24 family)